ncbi:hypothetical protein BH11VER1_BH11VER1_10710 [soil metagenome]
MPPRISAIVPAYTRVASLLRTLERICACTPPPDEILVHADGAHPEIMNAVRAGYPDILLLQSNRQVGPGGARNKLIAAAQHELVANFDDDSYPIDADYFLRIQDAAQRLPDVAVLSAITVPEMAAEGSTSRDDSFRHIQVFSGCGCVYRKSWFQKTSGYVPIPVAYSMEETDMSLRLRALGGDIVEMKALKVCHYNPLEACPPPITRSFSIANIALLGFLRFPIILWPIIPLQVLSRLVWLIRHGFGEGIIAGLRMIPLHLRKYAAYRKVLPAVTILSWLAARKS